MTVRADETMEHLVKNVQQHTLHSMSPGTLPCNIPIKSLTYMSHWSTSRWTCTCCHWRGSVLGCSLLGLVVTLPTISKVMSRQCAPWTTPSLMATFLRSVMVVVAEVKMGGDSFHPIGKTNGKLISWSSPSSGGNMMPNFGMSTDCTQMQ
jgi:hypothetical protein